MAENCATINGSNVGGIGANAIYELSEVGVVSDMSQVAYIDPDSILHPYESSNVSLGNTYSKMPFFDSSGNNLPNAPITVSSTQECQNICSGNDECYGFSIINGVCYPKNNQMYPTGQIQQNQNATLYVRNQTPNMPPYGAPTGVNDINASLYQNYVISDEYVTNSGAPINGSAPNFDMINPVTNPTMQQLQGQLNTYGRELDNSINVYNGSDITVNSQSKKNVKGLKNYLQELETTKEKIKKFDLNTSNILDNSDITVLQKNYNYMFWSILAIGTVVVSMNIIKK
jgi:filamentous hemagglutinin family protein